MTTRFSAPSVVAALALLVLGILNVASDLNLVTHPQLQLYGGGAWIMIDVRGGFDSKVYAVRKQVANGWRPGDRFSAAWLPLQKRLRLYAYERTPAGDRLELTVARGGRIMRLNLTAVPLNALSGFSAPFVAQWIVFDVLGLVALCIGMLLVVVRPGYATWGFYLFVFAAAFPNWGANWLPLPGMVNFALNEVGLVVVAAGYLGFVVFCARFPGGRPSKAANAIVAVAGVAAAFEACWYVVRNAAGVLYPIASLPSVVLSDDNASVTHVLADVGLGGFYAVGILAMGLHYRTLDARDRLKVRAVFATLAIYAVYVVVSDALQHFEPPRMLPTTLDEIIAWSNSLYLLIPITVLYAVLHYRVFGIQFVFSRALVYGVLTAALVICLTAVDLVVSKQLSQGRLAFVVEILVALGFAFSLDHLKEIVEAILRNFLFRGREQALEAVRRVSQTMRHAHRPETVDSIVTQEPLRILNLTSATIFHSDGSAMRRTSAVGWPPASAERIDDDAIIAVEARAHGQPIRIDDARAQELSLPGGLARPAVAIPMLERHDLIGLVFYGGHDSGGDIDPDELKALRGLVESAAHTFEHLEAIALRDELASLRAKLNESPTS